MMKIKSEEIKKYLRIREKINNIIGKFMEENELEGCFFETLNIVENCKIITKNDERILVDKNNYRLGEDADTYFVEQYTGYICDDYRGYVYIPTDEDGTYIVMYYEC